MVYYQKGALLIHGIYIYRHGQYARPAWHLVRTTRCLIESLWVLSSPQEAGWEWRTLSSLVPAYHDKEYIKLLTESTSGFPSYLPPFKVITNKGKENKSTPLFNYLMLYKEFFEEQYYKWVEVG